MGFYCVFAFSDISSVVIWNLQWKNIADLWMNILSARAVFYVWMLWVFIISMLASSNWKLHTEKESLFSTFCEKMKGIMKGIFRAEFQNLLVFGIQIFKVCYIWKSNMFSSFYSIREWEVEDGCGHKK